MAAPAPPASAGAAALPPRKGFCALGCGKGQPDPGAHPPEAPPVEATDASAGPHATVPAPHVAGNVPPAAGETAAEDAPASQAAPEEASERGSGDASSSAAVLPQQQPQQQLEEQGVVSTAQGYAAHAASAAVLPQQQQQLEEQGVVSTAQGHAAHAAWAARCDARLSAATLAGAPMPSRLAAPRAAALSLRRAAGLRVSRAAARSARARGNVLGLQARVTLFDFGPRHSPGAFVGPTATSRPMHWREADAAVDLADASTEGQSDTHLVLDADLPAELFEFYVLSAVDDSRVTLVVELVLRELLADGAAVAGHAEGLGFLVVPLTPREASPPIHVALPTEPVVTAMREALRGTLCGASPALCIAQVCRGSPRYLVYSSDAQSYPTAGQPPALLGAAMALELRPAPSLEAGAGALLPLDWPLAAGSRLPGLTAPLSMPPRAGNVCTMTLACLTFQLPAGVGAALARAASAAAHAEAAAAASKSGVQAAYAHRSAAPAVLVNGGCADSCMRLARATFGATEGCTPEARQALCGAPRNSAAVPADDGEGGFPFSFIAQAHNGLRFLGTPVALSAGTAHAIGAAGELVAAKGELVLEGVPVDEEVAVVVELLYAGTAGSLVVGWAAVMPFESAHCQVRGGRRTAALRTGPGVSPREEKVFDCVAMLPPDAPPPKLPILELSISMGEATAAPVADVALSATGAELMSADADAAESATPSARARALSAANSARAAVRFLALARRAREANERMAQFIDVLGAEPDEKRAAAATVLSAAAAAKFKAQKVSADVVGERMAAFLDELAEEPEEVASGAADTLAKAAAAGFIATALAKFKSIAMRAKEADECMASFVEELAALPDEKRAAAATVLSAAAAAKFKAQKVSADVVGERMAAFLDELAEEPEEVASGAAETLAAAAEGGFSSAVAAAAAIAKLRSNAARAREANERMAAFVADLGAQTQEKRAAAATVLSAAAAAKFKAQKVSADVVGERMAAFLDELAEEPEEVASGAADTLAAAAESGFSSATAAAASLPPPTGVTPVVVTQPAALPLEAAATISALQAQVEALTAKVAAQEAQVTAQASSVAGMRKEVSDAASASAQAAAVSAAAKTASEAAARAASEAIAAAPVAPGETRLATLEATAASAQDGPTVAMQMSAAPACSEDAELSRALRARLLRSGAAQALPDDVRDMLERGSSPSAATRAQATGALSTAAELADPRPANDIVLQLLAFTPPDDPHAGGAVAAPSSIFFSFGFYDFPQVVSSRARLVEAPRATKGARSLYLLESESVAAFGLGGTEALPGLLYKYRAGGESEDDTERFAAYLRTKALTVDVWDGDSMLQLGSASLALRGILRQGREFAELLAEVPIARNVRDEALSSPGAGAAAQGTVLIRVINIGRESDSVATAAAARNPGVAAPGDALRVLPALDGDGPVATELAQCAGGVGQLVVAGGAPPGAAREAVSALERRRLARQLRLRQLQGLPPPEAWAPDKENVRVATMHDVAHARDRCRPDVIAKSLAKGLSRTIVLRAAYGECVHFESAFTNPLPRDCLFTVDVDDPDGELSLVSTADEWRQLRASCTTGASVVSGAVAGGGAIEELFDEGNALLMAAGETVSVPFRFQSARCGDVRAAVLGELAEGLGAAPALRPRTLLVRMCAPGVERRAVATLRVEVRPRAFGVDRTLRVHATEYDYLHHRVKLAALPGASAATRRAAAPFLSCSDTEVIANGGSDVATAPPSGGGNAGGNASAAAAGSGDAIFTLKCGAAPDTREFYALLYADSSCCALLERWRVVVHSLRRHDLSGTVGQTARSSVALRGGAADRRVRCYTSSPATIRVSPETFVLKAGALAELRLEYAPRAAGRADDTLHVVCEHSHEVVCAVALVCRAANPPVSKSFELSLPAGRATEKKIAYTNPFAEERTFQVRTSHPLLLEVRPEAMRLAAGERRYFGLAFLPHEAARDAKETVMVFINDEQDRTVEALALHLTLLSEERAAHEAQLVD